ncbi:hypothetical protein BX600DRAFT_435464 [Xylariales sp. PMI_506]|nr:hypothetical protein BX600DRAFT_435464 [Xylariales sp. PMI_506]
MLTTRGFARFKAVASRTGCRAASQSSSKPRTPIAINSTAKKLEQIGLWDRSSQKTKKESTRKKPVGDKTRVNVISDALCDDVISYIKPSLERHKGCDIIDIYPGVGVWSSKLHQLLQPRSHILLEPDAKLYAPFLAPLAQKPGVTVVPKSGIVWTDLNTVLTREFLPHQKVAPRGSTELNQKNDTLLVTANIAFEPKKRFKGFESLAMLVLHQFLDAIKTSSLFHKYGQVRLLIWTRRDDKRRVLPRNVQTRARTGLEGELCCESLHEVVGFNEASRFVRDAAIDSASALATLKRMLDANVPIIPGRESKALKEAMENLENGVSPVPGAQPQVMPRPFVAQLESLKDAEPGTEDHATLRNLTFRLRSANKLADEVFMIQTAIDELTALRASGAPSKEIEDKMAQVEGYTSKLTDLRTQELIANKDNLHIWRQDPPLMHWDRRAYEPLIARQEEFYPNIECCLLDIQPGPIHHLLRETGPKSSRIGNAFDLILRSILTQPLTPIDKALDAVWPGAADYIIPRCDSFRDLQHGGVDPDNKWTPMEVRLLNATQMLEMLEKWAEWPFRPEFRDLVSRSQDESDFEDQSALGEA